MRVWAALLVGLAVLVPAVAQAHIPGTNDNTPVTKGWASFNAAEQPIAGGAAVEPPITPTPRPSSCASGSNPEPGMQRRMAKEDVDSGKAAKGYWCNLSVVGHSGSTGGFRVHRYIDPAGHECAYYDTS